MPIKYRPRGTTGIYAQPLTPPSVESLGLTMAREGAICIAVCIVIWHLLTTCQRQRSSRRPKRRTPYHGKGRWERATGKRYYKALARRRARAKKQQHDASEFTVVIYIALFILVTLALIALLLVIYFAAEFKVVQRYWRRVACIVPFVAVIVVRSLLVVQKSQPGRIKARGKKCKARRRRLRGELPPHRRRQNKYAPTQKEDVAASRRHGNASKSKPKSKPKFKSKYTKTAVPGQTPKDVGVSTPSSDSDSLWRKPCCHKGCAMSCGGSRVRSGHQRGSTSATISGGGGGRGGGESGGRRGVKNPGKKEKEDKVPVVQEVAASAVKPKS